MEERFLDISAELRGIISAIPEANTLWTQLIEQGHYTIKNIADYRSEPQKQHDAAKKIGTIVIRVGKHDSHPKVHDIQSEQELLEVLRNLVSSTNTNAPHSPPVERGSVGQGSQQRGATPPGKYEQYFLEMTDEFRARIDAIPEAVALLKQLEQSGRYVIYRLTFNHPDAEARHKEADGKLGTIFKRDPSQRTRTEIYKIQSEEELIKVLKRFLSPANTKAPDSPPVSRAAPTETSYQHSAGAPPSQKMRDEKNFLRASGESVDGEEVVSGEASVRFSNLEPESKSFFAKWCSWFPCGCGSRDEDRNPLLSPAPKPN